MHRRLLHVALTAHRIPGVIKATLARTRLHPANASSMPTERRRQAADFRRINSRWGNFGLQSCEYQALLISKDERCRDEPGLNRRVASARETMVFVAPPFAG